MSHQAYPWKCRDYSVGQWGLGDIWVDICLIHSQPHWVAPGWCIKLRLYSLFDIIIEKQNNVLDILALTLQNGVNCVCFFIGGIPFRKPSDDSTDEDTFSQVRLYMKNSCFNLCNVHNMSSNVVFLTSQRHVIVKPIQYGYKIQPIQHI